MGLHDLHIILHNKLCDLRKLDYLIKSVSFTECYARATDSEKASVTQLILNSDLLAVQKWLKYQQLMYQKYDDMTIRDLIKIAQAYLIVDYNQLTKSELIREILHVDRSIAERNNANSRTNA